MRKKDFLLTKTKKYLDYTSLDILAQYAIKGNDSPFRFDNINNTENIRFNLKQQIYGPIIFGLNTYLNIDPNHNNYGIIVFLYLFTIFIIM